LNGFGEVSWWNLIYLAAMFLFFYFYQRLMVQSVLFKLEKSAQLLENMSEKAKKTVLKKISKKPDSKLKRSVNRFLEFFVISPVSLDPYGVVKKLEHLVDLEKDRFKYFVNQVAPKLDSERQANTMMGLSGAISLYMLSKLVRHFVELIKKTKSLNLAMLLQMQLPLIERLASALLHGTEALANGWPVGDTIGAYTAAALINNSKIIEAGTIAEGVGVAIGGVGVEKTYIENIAVKKNLPLDSVIIKMSQEEAITPMEKDILNSVPMVTQALDAAIDRTKEKGKIIVVGVGNTSGVGNNKKDTERAKGVIKQNIRRIEALAKKKKKRFRFPF